MVICLSVSQRAQRLVNGAMPKRTGSAGCLKNWCDSGARQVTGSRGDPLWRSNEFFGMGDLIDEVAKVYPAKQRKAREAGKVK